MLVTSCENNDTYSKKNIEIKDNHLNLEDSDEIQINGLYEVTKDSYLHEFPEKWSVYDSLDKGSIVQVIEEETDGFVKVDYHGNRGYVETDILKGI